MLKDVESPIGFLRTSRCFCCQMLKVPWGNDNSCVIKAGKAVLLGFLHGLQERTLPHMSITRFWPCLSSLIALLLLAFLQPAPRLWNVKATPRPLAKGKHSTWSSDLHDCPRNPLNLRRGRLPHLARMPRPSGLQSQHRQPMIDRIVPLASLRKLQTAFYNPIKHQLGSIPQFRHPDANLIRHVRWVQIRVVDSSELHLAGTGLSAGRLSQNGFGPWSLEPERANPETPRA